MFQQPFDKEEGTLIAEYKMFQQKNNRLKSSYDLKNLKNIENIN